MTATAEIGNHDILSQGEHEVTVKESEGNHLHTFSSRYLHIMQM